MQRGGKPESVRSKKESAKFPGLQKFQREKKKKREQKSQLPFRKRDKFPGLPLPEYFQGYGFLHTSEGRGSFNSNSEKGYQKHHASSGRIGLFPAAGKKKEGLVC